MQHESAVHESAVHESAVHESAAHESAVHESAVHESAVHESAVHESAAHESAVHEYAMQLESTAVHHRASVQQRSVMMTVVHKSCTRDFRAHLSLRVYVFDKVSSDLVCIPAQLLDVLQELIGAHVICVQAGLMLAGHLRGPGRGFLTPGFICTHRQGKLSSIDGVGHGAGCVPSRSLVNQARQYQRTQRESAKTHANNSVHSSKRFTSGVDAASMAVSTVVSNRKAPEKYQVLLTSSNSCFIELLCCLCCTSCI